MALTSPGIEVSVVDESFYTSAEPGSVPLIVIATANNKQNGAGTAIAAGTLAANANNVYRITSQRELVETFGVPFFEKTATNNPVHGGERNEYGLQAAYSLLGVTNSVFIMRADVDLNQLAPATVEPGAEPRDGTWWINSSATTWGIQEWNSNTAATDGGQKFTAKTPLVLTDDDTAQLENGAPKLSVGSIGDYAVVFKTVSGDGDFLAGDEFAKMYFKSSGNGEIASGTWVLVGSQDWVASWPVAMSSASFIATGGTFRINGTTITVLNGHTATEVAELINSAQIGGVLARSVRGRLYIYSKGDTDPAGDSTLSGAIVLEAITAGILSASNATDIATSSSQLKLRAGTYLAPKLTHASHVNRPLYKRSEQLSTVLGYPTGSVWIKTTEPNNGARMRVSRWNASAKVWTPVEAPIYADAAVATNVLDRVGGGINIAVDTLYTQYNAKEYVGAPEYDNSSAGTTGEFRLWRRRNRGATTITSAVITDGMMAGANAFNLEQTYVGSSVFSAATSIGFTGITGEGSGETNANLLASRINAATFVDANGDIITNSIVASVTSENKVTISHKLGGEIRFTKLDGNALGTIFSPYDISTGGGTINFYNLKDGVVVGSAHDYVASNWIPLAASISPTYYVSPTAPLEEPVDGQLWYNPSINQVDLMVHNGTTWVGYKNFYTTTDVNGPRVTPTEPTLQSDGVSILKDGDIWISTADLENYPTVYRYNFDSAKWVLLDKTDQTSEDGILFADARVNTDGLTNTPSSIVDLLSSNFLDPDAPDPALYPKGMLLWNTRRSYGNVKKYVNNYIDISQNNIRLNEVSMAAYHPDRWVTASPNQENGVGSFGRKAQRSVVVEALKSSLDSSQEARDEERRNFNLMACPCYPETISNMINLNIDRKLTAFIIGDTPLRLPANATSLLNWGTNANLVTDNGDAGLVSYDEYSAIYYPNGFTTDLSGSNIVVPASHMMLRTIIISDQQSYPWFAPAGTRRGGITNATSVGYIDPTTSEFKSVALNSGQRDTLYDIKVNPIPFFVGVGHVAYGQKTRSRNASAIDRVNVSRLVIYLRSQLAKLARPYLFEPNDKRTRDEIKSSVESLLIELSGLRAIYDFAVVCDETNNTPSRIDRNELYVDVAIEPTKSIEFIYIPLRLKNTGEI